jgi:hypothetical protein
MGKELPMPDFADKIIRKALEYEPYQNLVELIETASKQQAPESTGAAKTPEPVMACSLNTKLAQMPAIAQPLAMDVAINPTSAYKPRGLRLNLSMRQLAKAKECLIAGGYVKEIVLEKFLFLAGTEKLYNALEMPVPYRRNVSIEHSFLEILAKQSIQTDPMVHNVEIEAPIGSAGACLDLLATFKNGDRWAFEITCSLNNVAANAAKLQGQAFRRVVFLCRDHQVRDGAATILRNAGFDSAFSIKIECVLLISLLRQQKTFFNERTA